MKRFQGICEGCHRWTWLTVTKGRDLCQRCQAAARPPEGQLDLEGEAPERRPDPSTSDWPEGF